MHRDVSENNVVLPVNPGDDGGAMIDVEMAVEREPNMHLQPRKPLPPLLNSRASVQLSLRSASPSLHPNGPRKAERTVSRR